MIRIGSTSLRQALENESYPNAKPDRKVCKAEKTYLTVNFSKAVWVACERFYSTLTMYSEGRQSMLAFCVLGVLKHVNCRSNFSTFAKEKLLISYFSYFASHYVSFVGYEKVALAYYDYHHRIMQPK